MQHRIALAPFNIYLFSSCVCLHNKSENLKVNSFIIVVEWRLYIYPIICVFFFLRCDNNGQSTAVPLQAIVCARACVYGCVCCVVSEWHSSWGL